MIDYKDINKRICDRNESWCWQTDRKISQEEVREIWQDKHRGISNEELIEKVNKSLKGDKLISINDVDKNAQENLEFINSVRVGILETGKMMRKMHGLQVKGFGSFDNEKAKLGRLECLYSSLADFVNCGLKNNLLTLVKYKTITEEQQSKILKLFSKDNPLLDCEQSVLIHNDFVDWNLLTDGNTITGILDLDECAGGEAVCDIASWSGMSSLERVDEFLRGYFGSEKQGEDFDKKLKLISFRWIISNMSLRNSRLEYMPDDKFLLSLIADGKKQMKFYMNYFNLGE